MSLTIDIHVEPKPARQSITTLYLAGSLDTATAPQLEQQLKPLLEGTTRDIVFDLAKLTFISSAGLRVFAATRKCLRERGGQASFIHLPPQIKKVFEVVAALPGIGVFRDTAEFDAYLAERQRA